jgi:hypothetical protein
LDAVTKENGVCDAYKAVIDAVSMNVEDFSSVEIRKNGITFARDQW